ncbi:hypothetical protein [Pantoea sp. At-9b]|uniref:hypothetical protein n=1 Tax=Pantoea sp. (strain At-9b) TaxID=592316 RepID=UPI00167F6C05|nr:hypothetical protein [Pantoea sp. At-9b]
MTKMEFCYYRLLAQHHGNTVPADVVIEHIWPSRKAVTSQNNLSQLTFKVKKKMLTVDGAVTLKSSLKEGCLLAHGRRTRTLCIRNKIASKIYRFIFLNINR